MIAIVCMILFVTSSLAVFEAVIRVKSTHLIKSWFKTVRSCTLIFLLKSFRHRIYSFLRRADDRGSADISYLIL